jgi:hypothetical protein
VLWVIESVPGSALGSVVQASELVLELVLSAGPRWAQM